MQITIEIPDAIAQRIQPHWSNIAQKLLELLLQAASQAGLITPEEATQSLTETAADSPDPEVLQYMEHQAALYEQQRAELLQKYQGQYIRFEDGNVIDTDPNYADIITRAYAERGPRPIFIRLVSAEDPQYQVRTPFKSLSA